MNFFATLFSPACVTSNQNKKRQTYLYKYNWVSISVESIYRYLDKLGKTQKEQIQKISYDHTVKVLSNEISLVFYDVTTLYFETEQEDELRKTGVQ